MTLTNRLAVGLESWVYLPPWNLVVEYEPILEAFTGFSPGRGTFSKGTKCYGYTINLGFNLREADAADGLSAEETVRQAFVAAGGIGNLVDLATWIDSGGTATRIFQQCQLKRGPIFTGRFKGLDRVEVELQSHVYPYQDEDSNGGTGPGAGDYEAYLVDGGTVTPMSPLDQRQSANFYFDEMAAVWSSGSENYFRTKVGNDTGGTVTVYEVEIVRARTGSLASGTGTLTFSTTAPGVGGGTQVTLDIGATARRTAAQTVSMTVANGGYVYCWWSAAAGHSGVSVVMRYR